MKKKSMDWYKQQQRFSVRKYHFGAASVLLGTALVFGGAQVSADEVTAPATPSTESTTATSAETTTASEGAPAVLTASEATPASLTASEASSSTEATSLDKGALQVALSQAKALDLSNKTSETVAILLAQIEHAQTVLNTATNQEELNQAVADLQAAQAQLADKPAQPVAVSPASVATTPAPATSTTSSTPEATTPAPATSTTSSTPEATTPASVTASSTSSTTTPASASTESSSSPTVSNRSRRTRRDTSASTHTPVEVDSTSTGSITTSSNYYKTVLESWKVTTKLTQSAKEGDYVEYVYDGVFGLNNRDVVANGIVIGTVTDTVESNEWQKSNSEDPSVRQSAGLGSRKGKMRVTFNKAVEDLANVEYSIGIDNIELGVAGTTTGWNMTSYIKDKNGVIASQTTSVPGANFVSGANTSTRYQARPAYLSLGTDGVYRGHVQTSLASSNSSYLTPGDTYTFSLDPASSFRFDLSSKKLQVGYVEHVLDDFPVLNSNNVYVTSGRTMDYELVSASDTKLVWRVNNVSPGESTFVTGLPVVLTNLAAINAPAKQVASGAVTTTVAKPNGTVVATDVESNPFGIIGVVADASGAVVPRADVYVQYVDEAGNLIPGTSKTLVLDDANTGTAYTTTGLDSNTYPNYTFVKMQDGSAPATGNSTTADIVVTYVYHYNTEAERFTPNGQDLTVKHNDTPSAEDGIANKTDLPTGTTYAWKGTAPDTSTPGTKPATITVSYPDGSSEDVNVNVNVTPRADDYTPVGKDVPAKHGDTPSAASGIANKGDLPADATYTWKGTAPDTTTPGDKPATVVVTYDDGTVDEVPVTVKVQPQADDYDPQAQPVTVDHGATPNAEDGIANKGTLPPGTTYDWKTPIDTSTPGTKPGTVVVTYPDGTKDEVPVPVTVGDEAALYTPVGQDVPAKHGETPAASQGIANRGTLPAGTTYDWKTPVDTTTPGDKPATVVVTYPDGSKDEVPVTVKVKPQSDEFTPNGQDVPTKHGETPNAADGIANKGDLPAGTTYDWKTPVDTTTPGDKPGTVVVTYPDGTKDEVPVTVKVKPQSDEFTPTGQDVPAKHGETPNATDGIANKGDLPAGTTYDWKTPVDTSTPGDKPGTVVVTYPDGTKDEVPVTVKVKPQSDEFTPTGQDVPAKHGDTPNAADGIANKGDLPAGTTYDWKTPVDTSTVGDKPATVVVTYPDGSKDEVPVTVKVTEKLHVKTPADKVPVKDPSNLTPDDINKVVENIKKENPGLPDDAKITVNPNGGDTTIETKDGDKVTIPGSDLVRPETDADKNNVKVPADKVPVKDPSNLTDAEKDKVKDNIKNANPDLPNGTKIDVAKDGTATITFPDGSTKVIPGTDLVRPEADADKNNVKVPADKVPVKDPSNLTDAEKDKVKDNIKKANPDLPNGTKIEVAKDGTATITFPDGSTKVIPGSDLVRPETDADRHTPKGQDVPVKQGETPKAEDGIANKGDLPNGTKIEWKETPDTSKVGDHNATIVITYPDGSKDEVTVTVKVSPNANNNGHNGNNGSQGNGNSGSHNNGTNGDQGQGDKDKKDQAGKDTNNGLDKLFSNSGNGSASGNQSGASRKQAPALPNTGDASNPAMALAFAALLGGTALVMKKRKKEEEE